MTSIAALTKLESDRRIAFDNARPVPAMASAQGARRGIRAIGRRIWGYRSISCGNDSPCNGDCFAVASGGGNCRATLLACGKGALGGASGFVFREVGAKRNRFHATGRFRTRGTARFGCTPSPPGFFPHRRGYGGRRPHPLKGHRPLRIPFAAAFRPNFCTCPQPTKTAGSCS